MKQEDNVILYKRVVQAKMYMDTHFPEKINLNDIAQQAYFSKFHFVRVFKTVYGCTPKNYLALVRINRAKEYLSNGNTVLETGFMVGLESPTSFAGMFKKVTGETPSGYQKQQKNKQMRLCQQPLCFVPACFARTHGWSK